MKNTDRYVVTVKTPYKSTRKILLSANTKLSALADCILDTYGIVKDRAYFYFTGDTPWEGMIYTDTAEFPKYLSAFSVPFCALAEEDERFVFQLGYDPEFVFECKIATSDRIGDETPVVVYSKGGTVSEFFPVNEADYYFEAEESYESCDEEEEYVEYEYTETDLIVDKHLRSFVSLYGVIPKKMAAEMILSYEPQLSLKEIRRAMRYLPMVDSRKEYTVSDREIIYTELFEMQTGEYFALKKTQRGKEYYLPEKGELLRYADPTYFEKSEAYIALEAAVGSPAAEDIYRMMAGGISPGEALLIEAKVLRRDAFGEAEARLAAAVFQAIRRWENRGFPKEG